MRIRNELRSIFFRRFRSLSDVGDVKENPRFSRCGKNNLVLKERFCGSPDIARVNTTKRIRFHIFVTGNMATLEVVVK
jgi:hypothetical protein